MPENVLVVDDDPVFCEIVSSYLKRLDTKDVVVVSSGREAVDILSESVDDVDLIVLDLNMPNLDGIETLNEIAELSFPGKIAIVSGEARNVINMAEYLGEQYGLNIVGTVKKPLTKAERELWLS